MDIADFRGDLLNRAITRASVDGIFTADAFSAEVADLLIESEEVSSLDLLSFQGRGRRRQTLAVNGFELDEQDNSVALVVSHFVGGAEVPSLSYSDASTALRSLEQYLAECLTGDFLSEREPAAPEYQLAQTLQALGERRGEHSIRRFRLYLVTDAVLSARAKSIDSTEAGGTPVEFHIWDMKRFLQVYESTQGREPLELDLGRWGIDGVPALRVADRAGDVTTYLAALPGQLLASLYSEHGSRLLEGNVRSFLTIRGKINRGIRETVTKEPGHFLAYNNGISATAAEVQFHDNKITKITDLQIVNGGQTTASLYYATRATQKVPLDDVFVQMKLVVVGADQALQMVPLISRYANSQNAVREDDFFSNSPFHVRMEELSKKLLATPQSGVNFQTKWYYERTRGQYLNERNRRTPAEQRKFEAEFPRAQVVTKTDAAKFTVTWEQQPHLVSSGAQKNFKAFAALVADKYAANPEPFNENYYRRLVAKAIIFNSVRTAISKASWYESGYLANLTTYAIAKLSLEISRNPAAQSFDLLQVWEAQAVGEAALDEAVAVARKARDVLTADDRLVVNVTEWAKRESAWKRFASVRHELSSGFLGECIPVKLNASGRKAVTVNARFSSSISDRAHVHSVKVAKWREVQSYLGQRSLISAHERRFFGEVIPGSKKLLDKEIARELLQLYVKAVNSGWDGDV